jgi:ABC-type lipoprotein release transport system permease subunit
VNIGRGIGRRVVLLLAMALVAATLATMSAASAFADELSDSQLRHKIHVIQNRPDPLTNQERNHIQNLKDRIHDNDGNDDDDDDD